MKILIGYFIRRSIRDVDAVRGKTFSDTYCGRCGAWLSMGPSNDAPEAVAFEIDVAAVVASLLSGLNADQSAYWRAIEALSATGGRNQQVIDAAFDISTHNGGGEGG